MGAMGHGGACLGGSMEYIRHRIRDTIMVPEVNTTVTAVNIMQTALLSLYSQ